MECPVRCVKYSPKPRSTITARAASSASPPWMDWPAATLRVTIAIAASRASRTALHTACARADGAPMLAIHVWSA